MAGTLVVQTLQGPTSGANANKVIIPSGQTLTAPGHVIQVVEGRLTTAVSNSTTSFADTGLSVSITPISASSKILVTVSVNSISASNGTGVHIRTRRGTTDIINNTESGGPNDAWFCGGGQIYTGQNRQRASGTITVLDEPSTTDEITYVTQFRCTDGSSTAYINRLGISANNGSVSTITVMEIAQ